MSAIPAIFDMVTPRHGACTGDDRMCGAQFCSVAALHVVLISIVRLWRGLLPGKNSLLHAQGYIVMPSGRWRLLDASAPCPSQHVRM